MSISYNFDAALASLPSTGNSIPLPKQYTKIWQAVSEAAAQTNMPAYLVGGYVRDLLLQRTKDETDIDIVCVGDGIVLANKTAELLGATNKVQVFKNFGTAMLPYNDLAIDFVGARKESYQMDSRKPKVSKGTLKDDQLRRDFTINAMSISLNAEDFGVLIDPFDGLSDLAAKQIKTPTDPEVTFTDDPLRMMRAIRFATQLNFSIHQDTYEAIRRFAKRIKIVSAERVAVELNKIIASPKPSIGFKLLYHTGLLSIIFPEMAQLKGVEAQHGQYHKDNFYHTLEVLDNLAEMSDNLWLRWSAVLHDIAKPKTKRFDKSTGWTFHGHEVVGARWVPKIFKRLKLPLNEKMKFVQKMVGLHMRPIALTKEEVTDTGIRRLLFDAGDDIDELMTLAKADITSKQDWRVKQYLRNYAVLMEKLETVEAQDQLRNWQPPITGEIIMKTFNIPPSRPVGIIKNAIREAILDGDIANTYEAAYAFMLKKGLEIGLTTGA